MTSEVAFFLAGRSADALKAQKPGQQGRVCKAGTVNTVNVDSEERTSDLPGR